MILVLVFIFFFLVLLGAPVPNEARCKAVDVFR